MRRGALVVVIFDAYKHGYQSIKAFPLLIEFPQMRLPWGQGHAWYLSSLRI